MALLMSIMGRKIDGRAALVRDVQGERNTQRGSMKMGISIKAAAVAAGLALAALAQPAAAATNIVLNSATMDTSYTANINYGSIHETAYSNGLTFNVTDDTGTYDLFGFCIDVFHNISLGGLGYTYSSTYGNVSDPLTTDYGNPAVNLTSAQKNQIIGLVDLGFILHRDNPSDALTSLKTAAIQAAIWDTIHPNSITVNNGGASVGGSQTYEQLFNYYRSTPISGDLIYIITDTQKDGNGLGAHQTFAIGWPRDNAVPEPATWALMIVGFGAVGAMLRRRVALAA